MYAMLHIIMDNYYIITIRNYNRIVSSYSQQSIQKPSSNFRNGLENTGLCKANATNKDLFIRGRNSRRGRG